MLNKILKKYFKHKETIDNFFWRVFQMIGRQGVTFLIFLLCAKLLNPYDFGIYNYMLAVIFFLIMFGDFGISTAASKYVVEYQEKDKDKLRGVLFNSGLIILLITILISFLVIIFGPYILKEKYYYCLYLLPLVFLTPITALYDGIYRGLKKFKESALIYIVVSGISLFFVYFLIKYFGILGALISQNIFYAFLLIGFVIGYRDFHFKINKEIIKEIGSYSLAVGFADLGIFLYVQFDTIVLGWFNYIKEISYLSLANKSFMFLVIPFTIFSQVIAPNITKKFVNKQYTEIKCELKKYFYFSMVTGIFFALLALVILKPITTAFLQQYNNHYFYLFFELLLIIFPIRVFGSILATSFIVSTGSARIMTYNNLFFGALNVVMDLIFIKLFGFVGVIFSTLILGYISVFVAYYYFNKRIGGFII